jgi:hypothetical protein
VVRGRLFDEKFYTDFEPDSLLGEQPAYLPCGEHPFYADGEGGHPMRDFALLRALDNRGEGIVEDPEEPIGDLDVGPQKILQVLHPFEVGDDDSTRIAQNVGDD